MSEQPLERDRSRIHLVPEVPPVREPARPGSASLVESYKRLADVFHDILAEQSLDSLLDRIADTLGDLVPYDTLTIFQADEALRILRPVMARDQYAQAILKHTTNFGEGITGWAVAHREPVCVQQAHLDPRVAFVPGTPEDEPEALISIPLIARGSIKGALNIYRLGDDGRFSAEEFELAQRFGDAAALALDNAQVRARLEHQAQTDSLTGLYNHRYFHERLRRELTRASRMKDSVAVLMLDIDDFKRVNDVHGHGAGDEVLRELAEALRTTIRSTDVACRLGGEEFAVIMSSCQGASALRLAERITALLTSLEFGAAGHVTVSIGVAQGPEHAMNSRELVVCAELAMMTAKARGKNQIVLFDEGDSERPELHDPDRDVRSIAHLKMLQSLSGKLNRLNDPAEIGSTIADELRSLIDYHNCRVFVVDGDDVDPVAFRGDLATNVAATMDVLACKIGEGITGRVAQTGESLLIGDASRCEFALPVAGTEEIEESLIAVALRYGSRTTGVIVISKLGADQFDDDDLRLLEVLAGHAAVALENARLYQVQRREAESAKALLEFARALAGADEMDEILARIVDLAATILLSDRTSVWMQDDADADLTQRAGFGHPPEAATRLDTLAFPAAVIRQYAACGEPFVLTAEQLDEIDGAEPDGNAYALAPMTFDGGRVGFITAAVRPDSDFTDRDLGVLGGLAYQAKLAITNAENFAGLEQTFLSTVEALANALEANDEYTSSHARHITDMAVEVGRELGLDGDALKRLELGALFHDIGKIGIPSSILAKPGRLTAEERAVIEQHPELGERIIAPIERLRDVCPVVRHCHEHYDGAGYPDKKAGDDIPLESRIILVCDAYHAMTTDRPYRKRLTDAEAIREIEENAGTQFDPAIAEVFVRLFGDADARAA